jgi:valine--pyruvate aminotransferase
VPGNYFFFGLKTTHPHRDQCLRINYAQDKTVVENGFQIIAEEVRKLMN